MNNDKNYLEEEILQVRSDILMHDLFNEEEMSTLEWTVMQILGCSYEEVHGNVKVENIRLSRLTPSERVKYVDLKLEHDNITTIIELNNNYKGDYTRNLLYAYNSMINKCKRGGMDYYSAKKTIKVILVNLNWYKGGLKSNIPAKTIDKYKYPNSKINDNILEIINVNLDYYEKIEYNKVSESDKLWKLLTITNKKELQLFTEKEKMLNSYQRKIITLSLDKEYRDKIMWDESLDKLFEEIEAFERGKEKGIEQGIEKGIEQTKRDMVINLYKNNVSIDIISQSSGMSCQEVKDIINNHEISVK